MWYSYFWWFDTSQLDLIWEKKYKTNHVNIQASKNTSIRAFCDNRTYVGTKRNKGKKPQRVLFKK